MFDDLPLWANLAILGVAAAVIWPMGARLARLADVAGEKTGLGSGLAGVLLLGGLTSLPEIAVSITATVGGEPLLSVNDVLGSASINVLILALADARYGGGPLTARPGRPDVMLQASLSLLLLLLVPAAVVAGDRPFLGMGLWSWALLVAYACAVRILAKARDLRSWQPTTEQAPEADKAGGKAASDQQRRLEEQEKADHARSIGALSWRIAGTAGVILAGGYVLALSAEAVAHQTGLGASFVGAVLLGACTSLPEVSTVLAAVRMGRYALALGDVFGTNLFNVIILVLVDALHDGDPILQQAGPFAAFSALLAAAITAVFLIGLVERRDRTVARMGMDSIVACLLYAAGLVVLYGLRPTG
ncbi:sodium:calcium antiporter [Rhizobacter sp. LjRoot28]|jgi:cation:H+ antiporter|uniref:sodium:calcium antiporter n=1 Tax=Rhizobacter sp. LjRoot28 TaxID=3342309 RepID=UPI003ECC19EA